MKHLLTIFMALCLLTACHKHHDEPEPVDRAVLVYMAADNDLTDYLSGDLWEMMRGSQQLISSQKLILFIDNKNEYPYFLEVANGDTTRLSYRYKEDTKSSDYETLSYALQMLHSRYPQAESYGLVLWGHATGWVVEDESTSSAARSTRRKAYGYDNGEWMEIKQMAKALESAPYLDFIFADCCAFQCVETAYELRHYTDYIIASAAEIPAEGGPYTTLIPALFSKADNFYEQVVDAYFEHEYYDKLHEPLSVVKTSELEALTTATYEALATCFTTTGMLESYPNVKDLIYYYNRNLFDMQDVMMRFVTDSTAYADWKRAFDRAVIYKKVVNRWRARYVQFYDFNISAEDAEKRMGGMSMFVPRDPESDRIYANFFARLNRTINQMEWYKDARLSDFGW